MINKRLPGFCFVDPTNKEAVNIRLTSAHVVGETRRIRAVWTPELANDVAYFHNIDAEAELIALLGENIRNEIDQQIIQDLRNRNNERFYTQNIFDTNQILDRWNHIGGDVLINHGHIAPQDNNQPDFGNVILPMARRVAAQTIGMDLVTVQPLRMPEFLDYNEYFTENNYISLPNEEGWYTKGTFESLLINMDIKPFKFNPPTRRRRSPRRI